MFTRLIVSENRLGVNKKRVEKRWRITRRYSSRCVRALRLWFKSSLGLNVWKGKLRHFKNRLTLRLFKELWKPCRKKYHLCLWMEQSQINKQFQDKVSKAWRSVPKKCSYLPVRLLHSARSPCDWPGALWACLVSHKPPQWRPGVLRCRRGPGPVPPRRSVCPPCQRWPAAGRREKPREPAAPSYLDTWRLQWETSLLLINGSQIFSGIWSILIIRW